MKTIFIRDTLVDIQNRIRRLRKWSEYKKCVGYNGKEYMKRVENIVNDYVCHLGIKSKIKLKVGTDYQVLYDFVNYSYIIEVPDSKILNAVCDEKEFLEMATNIAHEISHIYNEDSKYFHCFDGFFKACGVKEFIISCVLKETRADIFSMNLVTSVYGGYDYNWFVNGQHYSNSGYLDSGTRLFIVLNYQVYDGILIRYLFENIFEKDNYMCQADYQMTMLSKIKVIRGKERWVQKLICV